MSIQLQRGLHPLFSIFFVGAIAAGFMMMPVRGSEDSAALAKLNGGYFLLHQLSDDEAHVPMLFLIKHAPAEIKTFADEISKVSKETLSSLDRFQDHDDAIRFDQNPLPSIERDVRDSIKGDKQHQLLFGTSDSEFVRNFLVSQIEASTYAMHLNQVLADQETDPGRAKTLRHLADQWHGLRDKAYRHLRDY